MANHWRHRTRSAGIYDQLFKRTTHLSPSPHAYLHLLLLLPSYPLLLPFTYFCFQMGNNRIISVHPGLEALLLENGIKDVEVKVIDYSGITAMYGAARCSTQVFRCPPVEYPPSSSIFKYFTYFLFTYFIFLFILIFLIT